jgi:hypothetical protein
MSLSLGAPQVMRLFAPLVFQAAIQSMFAGAAALPYDAVLDVAVVDQGASVADPTQPPPQNQIRLRQRIPNFA